MDMLSFYSIQILYFCTREHFVAFPYYKWIFYSLKDITVSIQEYHKFFTMCYLVLVAHSKITFEVFLAPCTCNLTLFLTLTLILLDLFSVWMVTYSTANS